ncbi:MAG: hypothetical protein WBL25_09400 [Anaerolineales bacterium]
MESFNENIKEYRKQLEKGVIQKAYQGLMEYIMGLRTHFKNTYPDYSVSGSIYYGYMDMTYFAIFPKRLKDRKLKIAVVFLYDPFRFEVWLSGANKQVQTHYWKLFKENNWEKYHLVPTTEGVDSILEYVAVEDPDFSDLDTLTKQIESATLTFIKDAESFLSEH